MSDFENKDLNQEPATPAQPAPAASEPQPPEPAPAPAAVEHDVPRKAKIFRVSTCAVWEYML